MEHRFWEIAEMIEDSRYNIKMETREKKNKKNHILKKEEANQPNTIT